MASLTDVEDVRRSSVLSVHRKVKADTRSVDVLTADTKVTTDTGDTKVKADTQFVDTIDSEVTQQSGDQDIADSDDATATSGTQTVDGKLNCDTPGNGNKQTEDDATAEPLSFDPKSCNLDIENLVFEGGGSKGLAYLGCVEYLEQHGLMDGVRRFGGTSAGAVTAAVLALGYRGKELSRLMRADMEDVWLDKPLCFCCLFPNLFRQYGLNKGNSAFQWFGEIISAKSAKGNPDMTFLQLYKEKGTELCVVVTNLSYKRVQYLHPKTTPSMPIREALRMTIAIPGLYSAKSYTTRFGKDIYVDGAVLVNYPIRCFDGWYLSMDPEDHFFKKFHPLSEVNEISSTAFKPYNDKTLGFLVYEATENEVMRREFDKRIGANYPEEPSDKSSLYLERQKKIDEDRADRLKRDNYLVALSALMASLDHRQNEDNIIDKSELQDALNDLSYFTPEQAKILFGDAGTDVDRVFALLDTQGDGEITYREFLLYFESKYINIQDMKLGLGHKSVKDWPGYLDSLVTSFLFQLQECSVTSRDLHRSVGVNTGHVTTVDFSLEDTDIQFVKQRGYHATEAFFKSRALQCP